MRTYTLAFSIVVHLLVAGVLIVTPLVATDDELPEPRRAIEFIEVRPLTPPSLPAPPSSASRQTASANPHAAPIVMPEAIEPETGFESFEVGTNDGVPGGVADGVPGAMLTDVPEPPPPPPVRPTEPVPIGGKISRPQRLRDVAPVYPAIARAAGVQGTVILQAVIGEDGRVRNLKVLRSIQLLDDAAMEAVRQWQFTPTLLNGVPVAVVMTVTVTFTLQR